MPWVFHGDHGLGVDAHGHLGFHRVDAPRLGLGHGQADETGLGAAEGDAAIQVRVVFGGMAQQVVGGDAALGGGGVGQHVAADDVAHGVDVGGAGAAAGIGLDGGAVELDAGGLQVEPGGVGPLAGGHEHVVAQVFARGCRRRPCT
jgi:hypothetical protein